MKYVVSTLLTLATLALFLLSFGALIETNLWWVRMTDFPRLQYLIALIAVLALIAISRTVSRKLRMVLVALVALAIGYNTLKLFPYVPQSNTPQFACEADQKFVVMVANVKKGNRSADGLIRLVEEHSPDLFLALETDEWWDAELAALDSQMPHKAQRITGGFFGMHLFSRLPISETEVIFPVEQDAPAILTNVEMPSGDSVQFMGLHPRPPHPGQSSTGRDAQLMWAALKSRGSDLPVLVAGDLNAVPWETSIERLQRVGGFIDPREEFGYLPTYDAHSWWMSWPLDQILHQPELAVANFEVLPEWGSDHYPIKVEMCNTATDMEPPQLRKDDIAEAEQDIHLAIRSAADQR